MIDYVKYVEIQENYKDSTVHIKKDKLLKKVQILKDMIYYCVNVDLDEYAIESKKILSGFYILFARYG